MSSWMREVARNQAIIPATTVSGMAIWRGSTSDGRYCVDDGTKRYFFYLTDAALYCAWCVPITRGTP